MTFGVPTAGFVAPRREALPAPSAVLFDWDGTLVDNWPLIAASLNATFAHYGMHAWTEAEVRHRISASQRDSFPALFGERWQEAQRLFYEAFEAHHLDALRLLPGAEALVDLLERRGLPIGIVSNKRGHYLRREVAHLGWTERFFAVVGATDAVRDKPDPAPVDLALGPLGRGSGPDVWFVGDSGTDLATARACGCTAIIVHAQDDSAAGADAAFDDLAALARIVEV